MSGGRKEEDTKLILLERRENNRNKNPHPFPILLRIPNHQTAQEKTVITLST